ncbi:MAG: prepilin-type N-terminal cleavage/methylation domain-containing protein [Candidatus Zixiibacteriota bacterium]
MKINRQSGFTLLEVMIGMIILALGILGLASLIGIAIYGNSYSNDLTTANAIAQREVEKLVSLSDYGNLPYTSTSDSLEGFFNVSRIVEDNTTDGAIPLGVYKIRVSISWMDNQNVDRNIYYSTLKPKL